MWKFKASQLFAVIVLMSAVHGILVVGPKFIRPHQNYMLVVSNFNSQLNKVDLKVRMEGQSEAGKPVLNELKMVEVRKNMNRVIEFNLPGNLTAGSYKITIDGQHGFSFHKETDLVFRHKSVSGLIQMDKPVFHPGDTVKFRVIVLDSELKPPASLKSVHVTVQDPQKNVIRKWGTAKLHVGVFQNDLQIAPTPLLGIWKMVVMAEGEELVSKTFEVKEYVLSTFDVQIVPTVVPLEEHQALKLTIAANYHFGKPVNGLAKIELYLEDDKLDQKKQFDVFGMGQVELRFADFLEVYGDHQDVRVKVSFIEQYTNRTVVKTETIKVFKYPYRVELVKESPEFRPGHTYKCALKFTYHDGTSAAGVRGNVEINDVNHKPPGDTSDSKGFINLELQPSNETETMGVSFTNEDIGLNFYETINKVEIVTNAYMKLELKSYVKLNRIMRFMVTCTERMTFFVYYVVSKGNIVDAGYMRPNSQTKFQLLLNATELMVPKAKIIVATVARGTLVYDFVDIDFHRYLNNFDLTIPTKELKPGRQIELSMSGPPGAYVGLAAYDKALLTFGKDHDLFWEDIEHVFHDMHKIDENEYDKFHSMGLFARTLDNIAFDSADDKSVRNGEQGKSVIGKLFDYRVNFAESWLWKDVTIGKSKEIKLLENVPDTTTSWYLTAFSIDPVYGLGIIKKPIEFKTFLPFYIVENLPYSIKRGEAAVLQFTLFSNLEEAYMADVTLYNVANQTEFIGRSIQDLSYTKSVRVPPNVGVPVSFLVKARKLGEMVVRIKASMNNEQEMDALEKMVRVVPESIVQTKMDSRFFSFNQYSNQTFPIKLDIDKRADNGSTKIEFKLNTNLITMVINNLNNLVRLPTGCGEQTMSSFVPNIVVLDYLTAVGSNDVNLMNQAKNYMRLGYQRQMTFHQTDGFFGYFRNSGSSIFLTAFVAKSLHTASKYINEVDYAMVERAYNWLASHQHSSGRFGEVGKIYMHYLQGGLGNNVALTSYVLTALLENENQKVKHAAVIRRGMDYLSSEFGKLTNVYDVAIATYALALNNHHMTISALTKLIDLSTSSNNGVERYWNGPNNVEATAYALMAFVKAGKYLEGIPIMRWLVNKRTYTGGFGGTQSTFVGLKALTMLAEKISHARNDYTVMLKYKKHVRNFRITSQDLHLKNYADIPDDIRQIDINVGGLGFGLLQIVYQYSLDLRNFENRFNLTLEKQNTGSDYELRMRVCANFIPLLSDSRSNMALIEVNFPSGYVVDHNPISQQTMKNPIQNIEIRYGGTSVVLYYANMGVEINCFTVTAYRRFKVAFKRPAYVTVYDYYDTKLNAIKVYEVDRQNVCEICDRGDCPRECNKSVM